MASVPPSAGDAPTLFRLHPLGPEAFPNLRDLAVALHAERDGRKLSLEGLQFSYDGKPIAWGIRIGLVDVAGADEWHGVVTAPDLTLDALRSALRETVPGHASAVEQAA